MIENNLTQHELTRILRPFLRCEPLSTILPIFQEVLGFPVQTKKDVVCQTKLLVTYADYRIDIRDLRETAPDAASILVQFKAKRKWWHGTFRGQNAKIVSTLQTICRAEIANLAFAPFRTTARANPHMGFDEPQQLEYLHDSRAFNNDWEAGFDISPLQIGPDCHHGNCFVEFLFNSAAYQRSGNTTVLKDDWRDFAFSVSQGITRDGRALVGIE